MSAGLVGVPEGVWFSPFVIPSHGPGVGRGVREPAGGRRAGVAVAPGEESGPSFGSECVCGSCGSARRRVVQSFCEFE